MNLLVVFWLALVAWAAAVPAIPGIESPKLLYILLDGFRYDYLDDQKPEDIPGFTKLITNGVKAKWMNPLTPSISYPSWTSLSTGLYAEDHTIIGNYMYDAKDKDDFALFNDTLTGKAKWWVSEPIWTTAKKAGLTVALYLWARCDVPYDGVLPDVCEKFEKITGPEIFRTNIEKAIDDFKQGYDLVQVYTEHLDNIGHTVGPETPERRKAVREIDETLVYLQEQLEKEGLADQVNIVIVSDHGMANTKPGTITRVELDDFLPEDAEAVERIADKGTFINIKAADGRVDEVYNSLKSMPGVSVYKKNEVPEDFHVVGSPYMNDILIVADIGTFVMASTKDAQLPTRDDFVYYGAHGYNKTEEKMRAIFYANGPAFVSNVVLEPIELVDVYQVLTYALNIKGLPNNGTLDHVQAALNGHHSAGTSATSSLLPVTLGVLLLLILK